MALTEIPSELSSTPSIVDNGNATAITIGSDESATFAGPIQLTAGALAAAGNASLSHRSSDNKVYLQAGTGGFNILDDQQNTHFSIDSAGVSTFNNNVGIGGTTYEGSVTSNASSVWISSAGYLSANINNDWGLGVNRTGTDGTLINLRKNGADVGFIGTTTSAAGTRFAIGGNGDPGIIFAGTGVFPAAGLTVSDNAADLGSATYRWKDIYLSGGVNFSANANAAGASSELLDDYETGTFTPTLAGYYGSFGTTFNQGTRSGHYTKVGNLVTLSMEFSNAGVDAANNGDIIVITGLPFAIGSACVGSHSHTSIAAFAGGGWTSINTTQLGHLGNNGTASGVWTWVSGPHVGTSGVAIRLTITYRH